MQILSALIAWHLAILMTSPGSISDTQTAQTSVSDTLKHNCSEAIYLHCQLDCKPCRLKVIHFTYSLQSLSTWLDWATGHLCSFSRGLGPWIGSVFASLCVTLPSDPEMLLVLIMFGRYQNIRRNKNPTTPELLLFSQSKGSRIFSLSFETFWKGSEDKRKESLNTLILSLGNRTISIRFALSLLTDKKVKILTTQKELHNTWFQLI